MNIESFHPPWSRSSYRLVGEEDLLNGEDVLPGFECKVQDFFVDLDQS